MRSLKPRIGAFGIGLAAYWPHFPGLKREDGVSIEFNVKTGPITIVGVAQDSDGSLKMLAAEGRSLPGPILKIGNANSRLRFSLPPAEFLNRWCEQGPTHHWPLGVGHRLAEFRKLSKLIDISLVVVGANGPKY